MTQVSVPDASSGDKACFCWGGGAGDSCIYTPAVSGVLEKGQFRQDRIW